MALNIRLPDTIGGGTVMQNEDRCVIQKYLLGLMVKI
jgi:hypothetical protein